METGLNRNQIKYIAIAAMLLDHIAMLFIHGANPAGWMLRTVGRLTAPIMCCFIAEGYRYTSSKLRYGTRLFIFAVLSQIPFAFAGNCLSKPGHIILNLNVIYTLFLCFLILCCYDMIKNQIVKWALIIALIVLSSIGDWAIIAPLMVLMFWIYRDNRTNKVISYSIIAGITVLLDMIVLQMKGYHWYGELWQLGMYLFIPFIYIYNGQKGKSNSFSKWFFYIFYPAHLLILGFIKFYLI